MNTIQTNKEISVFNTMHIVFNQAKLAFLISATNYANLFKDGTSPSRFIKVKQHPDYKGIKDIEFEILPVFPKSKKGTLFEKSPGLYNVMKTLTHRPVYANHPTIVLTKCTHLVLHQTEFIQVIAETKEWQGRWAAIGYNGTGISMYHHSFKGDIEIAGVPGVSQGQGIYTFKGIGIMKALTYLRENGGKSLFSRIVVIAGHLASRCINFMDSSYKWHLTDEYLDPAKTMSCADLIQSMRICGNHKIVTPLKVWCNEEVMENIILTHYNLGGFISKLADTNEQKSFKDILEGVKFHKNKLGNRKVCKIKAPYKKVSSEKQDNTDDILGIKKSASDGELMGIKNGLEMVKKAYENKDGLVHKIIQAFIKNDFKGLSKKELDVYCEKTLNIAHYSEWNNEHNRYKLLTKTLSKYILDPIIVEYLNLL